MQERISSRLGLAGLALLFAIFSSFAAIAANNEAVGKALKELISTPDLKTGSEMADASFEDIKAFYASRSFKPVWSRDSGPKGKARALLGELQTSSVHGLSPDLYGVEEIAKLMKSTVPEELARMDFLFTGALVDFSHDLLNGRLTNRGGYPRNGVAPVRLDPADLVEKAAYAGNLRVLLAEIIGDDPRYLRLVAKMIEYVRLEQSGAWPKNVTNTQFANVRRILALTGDLPFDQMTKKGPVDPSLDKAVRSYQERLGLEIDGKLGPQTLKELNKPLSQRIRRIKVNLERRRWQNRSKEPKQLYLNLIDGKMKLTIKDKTRALLGVELNQQQQQLPTFYGKVTGATFDGKNGKGGVKLMYDAGDKVEGDIRIGSFAIDNVDQAAFSLLEQSVEEADRVALAEFKSNGGELKLSQPVDLFVTYLTVWATRNGKIQFRPDIYNRDENLIKELGL